MCCHYRICEDEGMRTEICRHAKHREKDPVSLIITVVVLITYVMCLVESETLQLFCKKKKKKWPVYVFVSVSKQIYLASID